MKYLFFAFLLSSAILTNAQSPDQKLSRDSVRYYQRELGKFWRESFDSLKKSDRYKTIINKLNPGNRQKNVTVELLANAGIFFNDFKNLNTRLKSIGQEEVNNIMPSAGLGLAIGFPVLIYGVDFSSYIFENSTASFKGGYARFFIGTNLFKKGRIALNPQIGFTRSYLNMFIDRSSGQADLDDLFSTRSNSVNLTHSTNYLDFALGFKLKSSTKEPFYWQFLRVGYRYGLKDAAWSIRDGELQNPPRDRNNQFYVQLCLGFDR
jgi:hypothetical protein